MTDVFTFLGDGIVPYPSECLKAVFLAVECEQVAGNFAGVTQFVEVGDLPVRQVLADVSPRGAWDLVWMGGDMCMSGAEDEAQNRKPSHVQCRNASFCVQTQPIKS